MWPTWALRATDQHVVHVSLPAGAFSELAASLNVQSLKLAPSSVWQALPFSVPRVANVTYPDGELPLAAREMVRALAGEIGHQVGGHADPGV